VLLSVFPLRSQGDLHVVVARVSLRGTFRLMTKYPDSELRLRIPGAVRSRNRTCSACRAIGLPGPHTAQGRPGQPVKGVQLRGAAV
jgi:hypothetical protein